MSIRSSEVEVIAIEGLPVDRRSGDVLVVFETQDHEQHRVPFARDQVPAIGAKGELIFSPKPALRSVA
jgi:hypothetical protein